MCLTVIDEPLLKDQSSLISFRTQLAIYIYINIYSYIVNMHSLAMTHRLEAIVYKQKKRGYHCPGLWQ